MNFLKLISVTVAISIVAICQATSKRFVFRQDDIEDYYHSETQINLLSFFMDRGIAVSAGIIGNYFTGEDVPLYSALQRCVGLGPDKCALFNHGEDAAYTYDQATSTSVAYTHMKVCDDKVRSLFSDYQMELFVPHQNAWNQYTLAAATQLGYSAVSASVDSYSNLPYSVTTSPLQLSEQTETGEYLDTGLWAANPISTTLATCETAAAAGQVCVIMTHPHEFAQGAYNWTMLQWLVNNLTDAGFTSVNFHTIIQEAKGTKIPTAAPTTAVVTHAPTRTPTTAPTTATIKTSAPTAHPTITPTAFPFAVTSVPTVVPTNAVKFPTAKPTLAPSDCNTPAPSAPKTNVPTANPTANPVTAPTRAPTKATPVPTVSPTFKKTIAPTVKATSAPSLRVTASPTTSQKRCMYRFDNVMDFFYTEFQVLFINLCIDLNIGVSLGIVANKVTGKDTSLYSCLQRCARAGPNSCDMFIQGTELTYTFGTTSGIDETTSQLQSDEETIKSLFSGVTPQVYIPSTLNNNTIAAVKSVGFAAVSGSESAGMAWDLTSTPIQLPQQTSTAIKNSTTGNWTARSTESIVSDCNAAAARGEVCVIQVTANEFANGAYTTEKVSELASSLQAAGFSNNVTFHTIISEVQSNSPSQAPTQGPGDSSSDSNGGVMSYLSNPPSYIIAGIVVIGLLLIGAIAYAVIMRKRGRDTMKASKAAHNLDSISTDNLFEFAVSVEEEEDKTPPTSLRISLNYEQLATNSAPNSPMAAPRSSYNNIEMV
eukprot:CAMPEP_0173144554 /NCGR_PEP_ID=MMETSP1105-20130129/7294_1 /TAXON_ID=2985 /ORGANISM="Ochromonas sp., Strain BG-1" /LENGTH=765 /DNA_ID=CAMNT_0014058241 /DNA_START=18 /DNA_END=2315 /DNA_ORIENTATION=+